MFAQAKLADLENRVKPDEPRQRETGVAESTSRNLGHRAGRITNPLTSTTSTARCGPACRVVWEGSASLLAAPIPIVGANSFAIDFDCLPMIANEFAPAWDEVTIAR